MKIGTIVNYVADDGLTVPAIVCRVYPGEGEAPSPEEVAYAASIAPSERIKKYKAPHQGVDLRVLSDLTYQRLALPGKLPRQWYQDTQADLPVQPTVK